MSWDFHVGQKVVCAKAPWDKSHPAYVGVQWPVLGNVYTIREMEHLSTSYGSGLAIWLSEIRNPVITCRELPAMELGFAAKCFRPLRERKTDISVFTAMLNPVRERADA